MSKERRRPDQALGMEALNGRQAVVWVEYKSYGPKGLLQPDIVAEVHSVRRLFQSACRGTVVCFLEAFSGGDCSIGMLFARVRI